MSIIDFFILLGVCSAFTISMMWLYDLSEAAYWKYIDWKYAREEKKLEEKQRNT